MACAAELCLNWAGSGCVCAALDIAPDVVCALHPQHLADICPICDEDGGT